MTRLLIIIFNFLFFISCTTTGPGLFGKQSLHEQYGKKLSNAGLAETVLGRLWFAEAEKALAEPISILLPFKQTGYFSAEKHRAIGLQFSAKPGSKLIFLFNKKSTSSFMLYVELWRNSSSGKPNILTSLDTSKMEFSYVVEEPKAFVLRLQPELLGSGEYTLSITVAPSLAFPVAGKAGRIGSVWGDARDAGSRSHEGIDIFAPRRTPVVASADGIINRVDETLIGGKVVWLRPKGNNLSLYYAHLDEQLVAAGEIVQAGDTLGLIGNTGNARTTPPHLHFGIYGFGGALDPLPFVNPEIQNPQEIKSSSKINSYFRTSRDVASIEKGNVIKVHTPLFITDVSSTFFTGITPDGQRHKLPPKSIQSIDIQLNALTLKDLGRVLEGPYLGAPLKKALPPKTSVKVLGYFNEYRFIETSSGEMGWLQ